MAKYTKSGEPNKNLCMNSNPGTRKWTEDNTQSGCTNDSRQHLKYTFISQCESLKQSIDDLRNDQTEIVRKLDILESKRLAAIMGHNSGHGKHVLGNEEALPSGTGDLGLPERFWMLDRLRRKHTSLVNDNRVTNLKNNKDLIVSKTQSLVSCSNLQHFRTILSASQQHGDCVAFQDVSMGATSEFNKSLVIPSSSHKSKQQTRQLRRFKTDMKEDNRLASYEAQIEHVRYKTHSQNRTQAKEELITEPQADTAEDSVPKPKKLSSKYSMKGTQTTSLDESAENNTSLMGAVQSQFKSKQTLGPQLGDSMGQFKMMQKHMKNMLKTDSAMDFLPALRMQLQTMLADVPELSENIQSQSSLHGKVGAGAGDLGVCVGMAETLESSGNGFPFMNMSAIMRSNEMELAYLTEYKEGKKHRDPGHCVETVICLDTSESMKGPLWTKAITFVKNFVQEVKSHPCGDPSVFERIALVTFGQVTRVQVHLTRHYHQVLSKLDMLSPSGPTPMMPGLKLCEIAIMAAGKKLEMNTMGIFPRIILITDGKTTSHLIQEEPDFSFTHELDEDFVMNTVQELKKVCQAYIDCVPLGESKIDFLTKIAKMTGGKIYQCEDWKKLGRRTKYLDVASKLYKEFLKMGNFDLIRGVIRTHWNVKGEDLEVIEESMRRSKESSKYSAEEEHCTGERIKRLEDQLLPIGTRVRRGPDWHWGDQDSQAAGTIVGYDKNNLVNVVWDNYDSRGRNSNIYRYAIGGHYDIMPVEEPRVLSPGERIAVGCKVRRGKDWKSADQDGGLNNVGTVIECGDKSEEVTVRWPNRQSHKYNFGKNGRYEVQLCDSETREISTSSVLAEMETESVEIKLLKEMDHPKVNQNGKDIDVEEMNRRNIEMSKMYITHPDPDSSVKESSSSKPEDNNLEIDLEVTNIGA